MTQTTNQASIIPNGCAQAVADTDGKQQSQTTYCWCLACDPKSGEMGLECKKHRTTPCLNSDDKSTDHADMSKGSIQTTSY